MYFINVFCHLDIYAPISLITTNLITPPKGGYSQVPSVRSRGISPDILCDTLWWNPPQSRLIWGVITHVYNPNSRMAWTTTIQKLPNFRVYTTSLPNIQARRDQLLLAFKILAMKSSQSSSVAIRRHPRYLKADTVYRGLS